MKSIKLICASMLLIMALLFALTFPPVKAQSKKPDLAYLRGKIKFRNASETEWQTATGTTAELPANGDLKIGKDQQISLKLPETGKLRANESTVFSYRTKTEDSTAIKLFIGSLECQANKLEEDQGVEITTPHGVAGIRGTEFAVHAERKKFSEIPVTEGTVHVSTKGSGGTVSAGRYFRVGIDTATGNKQLLRKGAIQRRHKLIWQHWEQKKDRFFLREKLKQLRFKRQQFLLQKQAYPEREQENLDKKISKVNKQIKKNEEKLKQTQKQQKNVRQNYQKLRSSILKKRGKLMQKRVRALRDYRKERIRKLREFESDRQNQFKKFKQQRQQEMNK